MGGFQNLAIFWILLHIIQYRVGGKAVFFAWVLSGKAERFVIQKKKSVRRFATCVAKARQNLEAEKS